MSFSMAACTASSVTSSSDEILRLASADNFRDVAGPGYATRDGARVRRGVFYRSNELQLTEADHSAWTKDQVKPYVAHALDCFGFDRVLYGSDWTVSELTHAYPTWVEILDEVVAGSSREELRKLYRDNAIRVYRLPA